MNKIIACLMALAVAVVAAADLYSHVEIQIDENHELKREVVEWIESEKEDDMKETDRLRIIWYPAGSVPTPRLVFINSEGKEQETLFLEHVPVSMVKSLFKEKTWTETMIPHGDEEEEVDAGHMGDL
jgi:hypothetical protein